MSKHDDHSKSIKLHPSSDPLLRDKFSKDYCFGFESIDQLNNWFSSPEKQALNNEGYVIAVYQATDFVKGSTQVIFKPNTKKLYTLFLNY